MKHAKKKHAQRSAIVRDLRTPKYQMRIVRDRTKYNRKEKHKSHHRRDDGSYY